MLIFQKWFYAELMDGCQMTDAKCEMRGYGQVSSLLLCSLLTLLTAYSAYSLLAVVAAELLPA